jgi:hypothetical protein
MPDPVVPGVPFTRQKASHVHPRLVGHLLDNVFFEMTVTIQEPVSNRTPTGGTTSPGAWADVTGLVDIPARMGVPESSERQANERTTDWGRIDVNSYVIVLSGYYPQIQAHWRVLTDEGRKIDIRGVLSDSAKHITTVTGRDASPGGEGFD